MKQNVLNYRIPLQLLDETHNEAIYRRAKLSRGSKKRGKSRLILGDLISDLDHPGALRMAAMNAFIFIIHHYAREMLGLFHGTSMLDWEGMKATSLSHHTDRHNRP